MKKIIGILIFLGTIGLISPFPVSEDKCSRAECKLESRKFNYKPGTSYQYRYETNVSTSIAEDSERSSQFFVSATVHFDVLDYCEWSLRVTDVQIEEKFPTEDEKKPVANEDIFKSALQDHPLRFSFHDGLVERICQTNTEEPEWSLNIKRGILSSMQNLQKRLDIDHDGNEIGVEGVCDFSYIVRLGEKTVDVTKTRNWCKNSGQVATRFHGVPYQISDSIPSSSYVNRSAECVQSFHSKRYAQILCKESVLLTPTNSSRGEVTVTQSLVFLQEGETPEKVAIRKHVGLQLVLSKSTQRMISDDDADALVNEFCRNSEESTQDREATAHSLLEKVSFQKLQELIDNESCLQEILKEKIFFSESPAALAAVRNMISSGLLEERKIKDWIKRLPSFPDPTISHLIAAEPLLDTTPLDDQYWLAVSGLAGKLCLVDPSLAQSEEVQRLMRKLAQPISVSCRAFGANSKVVIALRSLANAGSCVTSSSLFSTCISDSANDVALRAFSIESLRLSSCSASREEVLSVYRNQSEPIEIRIGAFQAAISCASVKMIQEIRRSLETEESHQVKSYVYTFLKSMQESSSPSALSLQSLIGTENLNTSVDSNFLKFSRNDELSFYSPDLDIGSQLQTSVVFAGEFFLPRVARVNLTADLFGRSYNVFEMYLRAEGFENVARDFVFGRSEKKETGLYSKWNSEYRFEEIDREYERSKKIIEGPKVTLFSRSFGKEISYENIQNLENFRNVLKSLNPFESSSLPIKNAGYAERKFFDESLTFPTLSGIPVKVRASGSAKMRSQTSTEADVSAFMQYGKANVIWNIDNRVTVPLSAEIKIEMPFVESGIALTTVLSSEVRTQGHLLMKSWNDIDFKFHLPEETVKLAELSSEVNLLHNGKSVAAADLEALETPQYVGCIGPKEKWRWGVKVCAEGNIPGSQSGRSLYAMYLKKNTASFTDVTLTHKVQMKAGAIHLDTRLAGTADSVSEDILVLKGEATMKEMKDQKEIRADVKVKYAGHDYQLKGEILGTSDKKLTAEFSRGAKKLCSLKADWNTTSNPQSSKFSSSVQFYQGSQSSELKVDYSSSDKKDLKINLSSPHLTAEAAGSLKLGTSSAKGNIRYSYNLPGSEPRFGNLDLKDADPAALWRKLELLLSMSNNKEMKNKEVIAWTHAISEDVQGYSFEVSGPAYSYSSSLFHKDLLEESFEVAFEARDTKAKFQYEGRANLTLTDKSAAIDGVFMRSKTHGFSGSAIWRTNGLIVHREDEVNIKASSQHGNLLTLNSKMVAKQPSGFSLNAEGVLGEDADFKCNADMRMAVDAGSSIPKKLDSSLSLIGSKFENISVDFAFSVVKEDITAKFEAKHGRENGADVQFELKKNSFLGNAGLRLAGMTYKTEVSYDGAKDELLAEAHLDGQRDIWLRLHRYETAISVFKRHVAEIKWDVNRDPTQHAKIVVEQSQRTRGQDKVKIDIFGPSNKLGLVWSVAADRLGYYTLDVSGSFGMNSENLFTVAVADQKNLVRFHATSTMTYEGLRDSSVVVSLNRTSTQHDLSFRVVRDGKERLKLTSVGTDEQTSEASVLSEVASLYAPFYREEPVDLTLAYRRNVSGYACRLDVKLSEEKMLKLETNWLTGFREEDTRLNADLQIVTPFPSIPRLSLGLNHVSSFSSRFSTNNTVFVVFNDERHEASFEVGLREESAFYVAQFSIGSPLIGSDPVTLAGFVRPSLSIPALRIELGMPGSKVVVISRIDKQIDGGMVALMSLEAPFLEGNKLEVLGEWNMEEKVVVKASALLGTGKGFRFESRYFFASLKNFDVGFILKTPWEEYENGGLLVQLTGDDNLDVVNGTVVGTFNNDEYTLGFFKETTSNLEDKVMKGELLIGLPRTEILNLIGSAMLSDDSVTINVVSEQGDSNARFKFGSEKLNNKEAWQIAMSNSRLLPVPTFDIVTDVTSLLEEEEDRNNKTILWSLMGHYVSAEGKKEKIKFTVFEIEKTEPNDVGEEGSYLEGVFDFTSTFDGLETIKAKVAHDQTVNGVIVDTFTAVGFGSNVTFKSDLNFGNEKTLMELRLSDLRTKKNQFYKITSKYTVGDSITVNGVFFSSMPKYKKVPWTLEVMVKGGSGSTGEEEGDYSEFQRDEAGEEAVEPAAGEPWSYAVKLGVTLPEKPLNGNLFVNGTMVDISVEGLIEGKIYMDVQPISDGQFSGFMRISLDGKELAASGVVEYGESSAFKKFVGNAKTPWESMQDVDVILEREQEGSSDKIVTKFTWDDQEMSANLGYTLSSVNHFGLDIQVSTPFQDAETIKFIILLSDEEKIKTMADIYLPRGVTAFISPELLLISTSHESTLEYDFSVAKVNFGSSALLRSGEPKMSVDVSWDASSPLKLIFQHGISVTLQDVVFAMDGKGTYSNDDGNTEFEGSVLVPGQSKFHAKADGQFMTDLSDGAVEIGSANDRVRLSLNHDLTGSEKVARILVTLPNSDQYETQVLFDGERLQGAKTSQVRIRSPISGLEDVQADFLLKENRSGVQALVKSAGEPILSLNADLSEDLSGRLKQYKGVVDLTSSMPALSKLKAVYDKKYSTDDNVEHELALTVNDFDESKWKYVKAVEQEDGNTKEVVELEGKYIIWPVALRYLFVKEYPTGKPFTSTVKRTFSIFDADEPKLRADIYTSVQTTEFGKEFRIEVAKVTFITKYQKKRTNWSHGTELQLAPDGSKNFGYEIQVNGTTITDCKARLILVVPQRSFGIGGIVKSKDKSFGAQAEISWDIRQTEPRVMRVYFQVDDVQMGSESGKKWKLGLNHRHLKQDLLIEGDVYQDKAGNVRGSSEFRYLPGPEHRLRGTVALSGSVKFPEMEQKSGLTLTLPKAKLNTTMSQFFSVNLKKLHLDSSVYHSRDESTYTSSRSLDLDRMSDKPYLYKVSLPEGMYETIGTYKKDNTNIHAELNTFVDGSITSKKFVSYTPEELPIFKLYSSCTNSGSEEEVFDLVYQWNNDRSISLNAVSLSPDGMTIPIYGHIALNTSHLLSSNLIWQPTLISDAKESLNNEIESYKVAFLTFLVDTFFNAYNEANEIVDFVANDMEQVMEPFKEDVNGEVEKLISDMEAVEELFETMYQQNDFLMKSVVGFAKILLQEYPVETVLSEFKEWLAAKQEELTEGITSKTYDFESWANDIVTQIETLKNLWTEKIHEPFMAGLEQISESLINAFQTRMVTYERLMTSLGARLSIALSSVYTEICNTSISFASAIYDQLEPGVLTAADIIETGFEQLTEKVASLFLSEGETESGESFIEKMKKLEEKVKSLFEVISAEKVEALFDEYLEKFIDSLAKTGSRFANIIQMVQSAKKHTVTFWDDNFEVTGDITPVWEALKSKIDITFDENDETSEFELIDKIMDAFANSATQTLVDLKEYRTKMIFVPEEGHFSLEQVLPFPWYSLKEKPHFEDLKDNQILSTLADRILTEDKEDGESSFLMELIDKLLDDSTSISQLYDGSANVHLHGFIRTFHGNMLDVQPASKCSYLLLRDFNSKSTSLILEKKTDDVMLTFLVDEYRVELIPSARKDEVNVLVNGKATPLPFIREQLRISFADVTLNVKTEDLLISCRLDTRNCEIVGSGHSLSHYAGLLGRHDSEVYTDKTKPNGERATDLPDLFSSWQVSNQCPSKPLSKPQIETRDSVCSSYFESSTSGLANCYGFVNPSPYLSQCNYLAKAENDAGRCAVVSAYEAQCRRKDANVEIPAACLRCKGEDGTVFNIGETRKIVKGTKAVADVLFVIENGDCIKELLQRLQDLVLKIDKELTSAGKMKNNRYGFLVYGKEAEIFSMNKAQLFSEKDSREIIQILKNTYPAKELRGDADLNAVKESIEGFPFRHYASKSIVLFPCTACSTTSANKQRGLLKWLESSRIPVHVLFNDDFSFLKPKERASLFGFDIDGGVTNKRGEVRKVANHVQLFKQATGLCGELAFKTNGTIFAAPRLLDQKSDTGKKALTAFIRQLPVRSHVEKCQVCHCARQSQNVDTKLICEPCGS